MFTGTTVRFPAIVPLPVSSTTTVDSNGQLVPTVKRGQAVKFAGGVVTPVTAAGDRMLGVALSDSDQLNLEVPIYMTAASLELNLATGIIVAQGDLLYSNGDGTFTNVQPGSAAPLAQAVNASFGQGTVEAAWLGE
jgi:hypothetical protein